MQKELSTFSRYIDMAVAKAIGRYIDMPPDDACEAIAAEWGEQMAAILEEILFNTTCGDANGMTEFLEIERENGDGTYFSPICRCKWNKWRNP